MFREGEDDESGTTISKLELEKLNRIEKVRNWKREGRNPKDELSRAFQRWDEKMPNFMEGEFSGKIVFRVFSRLELQNWSLKF